MITLVLPIIEKIANHALRSDPDALSQLGRINNQVIQIHCTDWEIVFHLIPTTHGLCFEKKAPTAVSTTVKSTLPNFLKLLSKGANTATLFHHPVEITGNTHNLDVLRDTFQQLEIDWEEALSHYVGDAVAHKLCFYANKANQSQQNARDRLRVNIQEYLQLEARALPTRVEIEQFYTDVATLRDDVDRFIQKNSAS